MGGEGSILGMIISYRENMQKRRKKSMFDHDRKFSSDNGPAFNHPSLKLDIEKLTDEELKIYRDRAIRYNKMISRRRIALFVILIIPITFIIYGISRSFTHDDVSIIEIQNKKSDQELHEDFIFYLTDGDYWANLNKWNNAIYQYKNALNILPKNFLVNYRLARAYVFNCKSNHQTCNEAMNLLNYLITNYPGKSSLYELRAEYYISVGLQEKANRDYQTIENLSKK